MMMCWAGVSAKSRCAGMEPQRRLSQNAADNSDDDGDDDGDDGDGDGDDDDDSSSHCQSPQTGAMSPLSSELMRTHSLPTCSNLMRLLAVSLFALQQLNHMPSGLITEVNRSVWTAAITSKVAVGVLGMRKSVVWWPSGGGALHPLSPPLRMTSPQYRLLRKSNCGRRRL